MVKLYLVGTMIVCVSALLFPLIGLWVFLPLLIGVGIQAGCLFKSWSEMKALQVEYDTYKQTMERNQQIGMRDYDS